MSIKAAYLRVKKYLEKHGIKAIVERALLEFKNQLFFNRDIVFRFDLLDKKYEVLSIPEKYVIERMKKRSEIPDKFMKSFKEHQAVELLDNNIRRRFENGAFLWCLIKEGDFIGYIWSIVGKAMKPYYLPLTENDVHMFDNFIFPQYRGRMYNSILMNHVLERLRIEGLQRAYMETAEWNRAECKSLIKNGFVQISFAKKRFRCGKNIVTWWD